MVNLRGLKVRVFVEGNRKTRRGKEKEQPATVLGKKGINNQLRQFLLLRIQFSAKSVFVFSFFFFFLELELSLDSDANLHFSSWHSFIGKSGLSP